MSGGAKVDPQGLGAFRLALIKFQEAAISAMGDAESDVLRTINWLENDQYSYWSTQIRQRQEGVARAQEAVRQKTLFKDSTGRTQSAIEEQKALMKAQARLVEAEQKMAATKHWSKRLQKELLLYKGAMQRFQTTVSNDIPSAASHLAVLITALQEYLAQGVGADAGAAAALDPALAAYFSGEGTPGSMARAAPGEEKTPETKEEPEKPKPPEQP